ncbi:unnamed protein product [Meloidogyne enterolobii]|uniref:Uncharacterized protein n=1 Tax=Meloidogyne enterolobii TaxID=390850 RepID=A0ACB1ASN3_MELEN
MERVDRKQKKDDEEDEKTRKEIEKIKKDMDVIKFDVQMLKNWRATVEKQKEEAREQAQEDQGCGGDGAKKGKAKGGKGLDGMIKGGIDSKVDGKFLFEIRNR